jgi:SepF-like predicted cell division protein (DUF552 family)
MSTSPRRMSRAALSRLEEQEDILSDPRAQQLRSIAVTQDPAVLNALEAIFQGTGVMADEQKAQMLVQVRHEVHAEWRKAKQSFLAIGKSLLAVEQALAPDEFRRLSKGTERIFPFSETIATQLRQVARAVISGRLNETEMPGSYSVAYQIAVMDGPTIEIARSRNLVRPDVTRTEVIAFRREISAPPASQPQRLDISAVRREKARLTKLRDELAERLAQIDARIAELSAVET